MKYKFYEEPPKLNACDDSLHKHEFIKEKNFIAKGLGCRVQDVVINVNHPVGEDVIFVKGKYAGYLDFMFYESFDANDWNLYWDFDN